MFSGDSEGTRGSSVELHWEHQVGVRKGLFPRGGVALEQAAWGMQHQAARVQAAFG